MWPHEATMSDVPVPDRRGRLCALQPPGARACNFTTLGTTLLSNDVEYTAMRLARTSPANAAATNQALDQGTGGKNPFALHAVAVVERVRHVRDRKPGDRLSDDCLLHGGPAGFRSGTRDTQAWPGTRRKAGSDPTARTLFRK